MLVCPGSNRIMLCLSDGFADAKAVRRTLAARLFYQLDGDLDRAIGVTFFFMSFQLAKGISMLEDARSYSGKIMRDL